MQVELTKCKLEILQKLEDRKEKDVEHKEKQEECKTREHLFDKWERIQVNITQLCKDRKNETEDLKRDIKAFCLTVLISILKYPSVNLFMQNFANV